MQALKNDLSNRKQEAKLLLDFIRCIDENPEAFKKLSSNTLTVKTSIKANILLMLYNAVEATVNGCLVQVHENIVNQNVHYCDLNNNLRSLVAMYYEKDIIEAKNVENRVEANLKFLDLFIGKELFVLKYKEFSKHQLFSGNLDFKEIKKVLKKYGIELLDEDKCTVLRNIKDNRNYLAHGERSFEDVGRDFTVPRLDDIFEKTFRFLEILVGKVDDYILHKRYLRTQSSMIMPDEQ